MANVKQPTPITPEGTDGFNPAAAGPEESEDFAPLSGSRGPNPFKGWVRLDKPFRKVVPGATEPLSANVHVKAVLTGIRRDAREQNMGLRERVTEIEGGQTLIQWQGYRKSNSPGRKPADSNSAPANAPKDQVANPATGANMAAKKTAAAKR